MDRRAAMRIIRNTGTDRVIDIVRPCLRVGNRFDLAETLKQRGLGNIRSL